MWEGPQVIVRCLVIALLVACGSHAAPTAVAVEVICGDRTSQQPVIGDIALDEHLCGEPWSGLEIEAGSGAGAKMELLRAVEGRSVMLRRTRTYALVEVRGPGTARSTLEHVTRIRWRGAHEDATARTLAITTHGVTKQLPLDELRRRYAGSGNGARELSLCQLAGDSLPNVAKITVYGEHADPVETDMVGCQSRGLVLKLSDQGAVRLRAAVGERLLQNVERIELQ
jgi:hypothetical protein